MPTKYVLQQLVNEKNLAISKIARVSSRGNCSMGVEGMKEAFKEITEICEEAGFNTGGVKKEGTL